MKKLHNKSSVHPSPPFISDQLAFLPATILTLTIALSSDDREILAYLLSSSCSVNFNGHRKTHHPPSFNCSCFACYMSYWVRWDSSPNRELIHEIIDDFENELVLKSGTTKEGSVAKNNRKQRRVKKKNNRSGELNLREASELKLMDVKIDRDNNSNNTEEIEKGTVKKFVSFIGERIWSVWI